MHRRRANPPAGRGLLRLFPLACLVLLVFFSTSRAIKGLEHEVAPRDDDAPGEKAPSEESNLD